MIQSINEGLWALITWPLSHGRRGRRSKIGDADAEIEIGKHKNCEQWETGKWAGKWFFNISSGTNVRKLVEIRDASWIIPRMARTGLRMRRVSYNIHDRTKTRREDGHPRMMGACYNTGPIHGHDRARSDPDSLHNPLDRTFGTQAWIEGGKFKNPPV